MTPISSLMQISDTTTVVEAYEGDYRRETPEGDVLDERDDRTRPSNKVVSLTDKIKERESRVGSTEEFKKYTEILQTGPRSLSLTDTMKWGNEVSQQPSAEFTKIVRSHFTKPILAALQNIKPYALSLNAAVYIDEILHKIRQMEKDIPHDPFLELLYAFYDALAYENQWLLYNGDQFVQAKEVLKQFAERVDLPQSEVEKAIMRLEQIGFDTTPIPLDSEDQ